MSTSTARLAWLADVTADDLALAGIDPPEGDQPAGVALADWARGDDVDLGRVHDCLVFLQSGPHLLLAPSPLALMAYSPRRASFRASFDVQFPDELADAGFARAGAWLTVLAAEVGELPTTPDHWLVATMGASGLDGLNVSLLAQAQKYASALRELDAVRQGPMAPPDHTRQVAQAIWRCAAYALR